MTYKISCVKCDYESSCDSLPKGYNLKKCPKCGSHLRFLFNWRPYLYWLGLLGRGDLDLM